MSLLVGSVCLSVFPEGEHRTLARRMSAPGLTSEAQLRYILQWFGEFSELQREDFLPVLVAAKSGQADSLAEAIEKLSCQDKPVSLFQCRIKLFNEWYPTWAEDERDRLVKGVTEMDPEFGEKLQEAIVNGFKVNGVLNGTDEANSPTDEEHNVDKSLNDTPAEEPSEEPVETPAVAQDNMPVEIAAAS